MEKSARWHACSHLEHPTQKKAKMPLMEFYAGSNDRCYRCKKPGDPKLRTCARCRIARYCSPECQKNDWPLHKGNCTDHKTTLKNHEDPSMDEKLRGFLKWLDLWRDALLAWGAFCADLANQPPQYLLTHSYLVEIEKRPPDEAAKHSTRSKYLVRAVSSKPYTIDLCSPETGNSRRNAHRRSDSRGIQPPHGCRIPHTDYHKL
ncbi:hypothetical protein B0H19DRAFT_371039 [Mycena capillaripes]|nr:hypothetical protein B0H19DRAFT_371039 [Mycena capillaripes]